jgi:transposase
MRVGNKRYDQAFREGAVALLERSDRTMNAVAVGLGIPAATLRYWYKQAEMAKKRKLAPLKHRGSPAVMAVTDPPSDKERIAQLELELEVLRKRNEELEMDRAILKKAAAFFAKESE